jgi:hypothetical protein
MAKVHIVNVTWENSTNRYGVSHIRYYYSSKKKAMKEIELRNSSDTHNVAPDYKYAYYTSEIVM